MRAAIERRRRGISRRERDVLWGQEVGNSLYSAMDELRWTPPEGTRLNQSQLLVLEKLKGFCTKTAFSKDEMQQNVEQMREFAARNQGVFTYDRVQGDLTALMVAVYNQNVGNYGADLLNALIDIGCDVNMTGASGSIAPLHAAVMADKAWAVSLLLERGADKSITVTYDGKTYTALQLAYKFEREECIQLLGGRSVCRHPCRRVSQGDGCTIS